MLGTLDGLGVGAGLLEGIFFSPQQGDAHFVEAVLLLGIRETIAWHGLPPRSHLACST
ncbi:MAG: hypothetical protein H6706_14360 [Myxococcales bacterium]|nr:hypothetical protein [Myxococcales bacterium]